MRVVDSDPAGLVLSPPIAIAPQRPAKSNVKPANGSIAADRAAASERGEVMFLICAALVVRAIVVLFSYHGIADASSNFNQFSAEMGWVARSLALGHGFSSPFYPATGPTALVPPLFPFLLAAVFRVFGLYTAASAIAILLIDSIFSALTCLPIYLSLRDVAGQRQAQWAGWLWAVYPFAIYYSAAKVWDYALTSLLFAWCFYLVLRLPLQGKGSAWFSFGLLCGVAVLSNPSVLSVLPILFLLRLWKVHRAGETWLIRGTLTAVAFFLVVSPWLIRNAHTMHKLIPVRDGFWLEFWAGNHGDSSTSNPPDSHPASNPAEMQKFEQQGEIAYLAEKRVLALQYVHEHPAFLVVASLRRALRFWTGFWSFSRSYLRDEELDVPNVFFCGAVTILMLLGLRRWWRKDVEAALPYALTLFFFPVVYYVTHASMDYRQPIEPEIVILVAVALWGFQRPDAVNQPTPDPNYLQSGMHKYNQDHPMSTAMFVVDGIVAGSVDKTKP